MNKRLLSSILAVMIITLSSCGDSSSPANKTAEDNSITSEESQAAETDPTDTEQDEPAGEAAGPEDMTEENNAAAADQAIQAKAKVGSPAKVEMKDGYWMGMGLAVGLAKTKEFVKKQSERLAGIPEGIMERAGADISMFGADARLDESLSYHREQTIVVRTYLDKREIGRAAVKTGDGIRKTENRRRGLRAATG